MRSEVERRQQCRNNIYDELAKFQGIVITQEEAQVIDHQAIFLDERFKKLVKDNQFNKTNIKKALQEAECLMYIYNYLNHYHSDLLTPENIEIINNNAIIIDEKFQTLFENKQLDEAHIIEALKNIEPQNKALFNVALLGIFAGGIGAGTTLALNSSAQSFVFNLLPFLPHAAAIGSAVAICAMGIALLAILVKMLMNHLESLNKDTIICSNNAH